MLVSPHYIFLQARNKMFPLAFILIMQLSNNKIVTSIYFIMQHLIIIF